MTTGAPASGSAQQPFAHPQPAPLNQTIQAASPPTKQSLKSWWKTFSKPPPKNQEQNGKYPFSWYPVASPFRSEQNYYTGSLVLTLHSDTQGMFKESPMDTETPIADGSVGDEQVTHDILSSSRRLKPSSLNSDQNNASNSIPRRRYSSFIPGVEHLLERSSRAERQDILGTKQSAIFTEQMCDASIPTATCCPISSEGTPNKTPVLRGRRKTSFSSAVKFVKTKLKTNAKTKTAVPPPTGIFGVPLRQSITYANVAISLVDAEGRSYIYGYVPIVVAKCGVYLKEKGMLSVIGAYTACFEAQVLTSRKLLT